LEAEAVNDLKCSLKNWKMKDFKKFYHQFMMRLLIIGMFLDLGETYFPEDQVMRTMAVLVGWGAGIVENREVREDRMH
jgi:hypothetical protein